MVGALGLSVPTVRMDDRRADELGRRCHEVAWEVSESLGAMRFAVDRTLALASPPGAQGAG